MLMPVMQVRIVRMALDQPGGMVVDVQIAGWIVRASLPFWLQ
jgi:hypothetical protein